MQIKYTYLADIIYAKVKIMSCASEMFMQRKVTF